MHLVTTIIKNTLTFVASNVKKLLTYLPSKTWIGIGLGDTEVQNVKCPELFLGPYLGFECNFCFFQMPYFGCQVTF